MGMVLPTILVLLLVALIGWALISFLNRLDRMGGHGYGVQRRPERVEESQTPK